MAHFAELDLNNKVIRVIVVNNATIDNLPFPESEPVGVSFCKDHYGSETIWKQTSYNANFRKNYATFGYVYDATLDAFLSPKPYPSWLLNTQTCQWEPPVPYPTDGKIYTWDENLQTWVESDI